MRLSTAQAGPHLANFKCTKNVIDLIRSTSSKLDGQYKSKAPSIGIKVVKWHLIENARFGKMSKSVYDIRLSKQSGHIYWFPNALLFTFIAILRNDLNVAFDFGSCSI